MHPTSDKDRNQTQLSQQIDAFAWCLARRKARQLTGRLGFTESDREDIEQELLLGWLQALPRFDPLKGHLNVFSTVVLTRLTIAIWRHRQLAKSDWRKQIRLDAVDNDDGRTITSRVHEYRTRRWRRSDAECVDLAIDVAARIASLPPDLRELAERLKSQSISEIARALGTSRKTIYHKLKRLRRYFANTRLDEYLWQPKEVHA